MPNFERASTFPYPTMAAECQNPNFLIGRRNKKNTKKKVEHKTFSSTGPNYNPGLLMMMATENLD
jgi:hypothetical protein